MIDPHTLTVACHVYGHGMAHIHWTYTQGWSVQLTNYLPQDWYYCGIRDGKGLKKALTAVRDWRQLLPLVKHFGSIPWTYTIHR